MSTMFLCKFVFVLLITPWEYACSSNMRRHYGGRVLNIAPKACTSPQYPQVTGTCMISLECQQRSGTVIGACRDGHLFGACCSDASEFPTASPLQDVSISPALNFKDNFQPFKIPQGLLDLAVFSIASDKQEHEMQPEIRNSTTTTDNNAHVMSNTNSSDINKGVLPPTVADSHILPEDHPSVISDLDSLVLLNENLRNNPDIHQVLTISNDTYEIPRTTISIPSTTTSTTVRVVTDVPTTSIKPTLTTKVPIISTTPSTSAPKLASEITKRTTTSKPSTTTKTKFVYGKLKYSPRPVKRRSTTEKMVWTRPPTTEASYSVFTSSNEDEDEDEDEGNEISKRITQPHTTSIITFGSSGSVETSTLPILQPPVQSTEEVATTLIAPTLSENSLPSKFIIHEPIKPIELPTTTEKVTAEINTPKPTVMSSTVIPVILANSAKQSRLSNEIDDDDTESNSSGWDNKINEFVNQVVAGIATELDKSNIDDVVFKAPLTTTHKMTTTTTPVPIKKPKHSLKSKHPLKSKHSKPKGSTSNKKHKVAAATTTKRTPTKKPKPSKPSKKKVQPSESLEIERDVLDYREVCGVRPLARHSRIVGGSPSIHGNWPWHALVKETVWWGIFSKIKCGGVLIGPQHVLTAAHCGPQHTGTLSVVLGGLTDSDNPSSHTVTKGVRRVIRHPQFNQRSYENDIAILELDSPVQFQPHVVPICLPDLKETFVGKKGFVTGMGLLKHDGERPSTLYEVDVPILNNTDCQKMFRKSGNMKPIKPSFICAGYRHGRKDSCGGDSGGPLSVKRNNGQWVLAGTVSHGIKCAVPNQPGIYMRTTWYLPWIEKVLRSARKDLPKCYGPGPVCDRPQARSGVLMDTLFRIFRITRRLWKTRK